MAERFFLNSALIGDHGRLMDDQAHHAIHVMRHRVGDSIILFDGKGNEYRATITQISKKELEIQVLDFLPRQIRPSPIIAVASALPKGDRQKFLVEKLVELGCDRFIPLKCQRSVALATGAVIERFKKGVVEACKQCDRKWLMEISEQQTVESLIQKYPSAPSLQTLVANPHSARPLEKIDLRETAEIIVAIGPEGGFNDSEFDSFEKANWKMIRLTGNILRIETAAILSAGLLVAKRESNQPQTTSHQ
jgi:16S rRNA (uracil1498-N3)-methyltransferase